MTRKQTRLWKTKDGEKIRICDMSDQHLDNTIKFLERLSKITHKVEFHSFPFGLSFSGEMAQYEFEKASDSMLSATDEDYLPDIYYNLVDEQERRKNK